MTNRTRDSLVISVFCAFLFFYGLGPFGLIGADEPRYAQVAREMLEHRDWITPRLGGKPWLEKPPLYYWQAMLAYTIFGVSDWAARVPAAVDATVIVLAAYIFLRRSCPGFELDGALITASCAGIIGYARAASMDITLASAFTLAMLAWWTWRDTGRRAYLAGFYACLALGMLAKGPVAPFLAAAIIVLYSLAARELRLIVRTLWLPGFLLFSAIALPWYVAVQARNPQFFRVFILEHNLARFSTDIYHHTAAALVLPAGNTAGIGSLDDICGRGLYSERTSVVVSLTVDWENPGRVSARRRICIEHFCLLLVNRAGGFLLLVAIEVAWLHSSRRSGRGPSSGGIPAAALE